MLYFTLGRAGSGKTTWIRRLVADFVKSGAFGATLIVPEQFSFETERAMLALLGEQHFDRVNILSFTRLAENLFEEHGVAQKPCIGEGARAVLMSLAADALQDGLTLYARGGKSAALIRDLLFMDEELKLCALTPQSLAKASAALPDGALKTKTAEFSKILSLYQALVAERFSDERDILTRLCDFLKTNNMFHNQIVAFDAFRGFTKAEYAVIEQMMLQAKAVYFTLPADSLEEQADMPGPFAHPARAIQTLMGIAKKHNIHVAMPQRLSGPAKYNNFPLKLTHFASKELFALEQMLCSPAPLVYSLPAPGITVYAAMNPYDECEFVAMQAKKLIRERGYRCREIAIIERTAGVYRPALVAALRKYGLTAFLDNRHNIQSEPLIAMLSSALAVAVKGFSTEAVLRYLKSGLTPFSAEDIALVENYVFVWQIDGAQWKQQWESHPEGYGNEFSEKNVRQLFKINAVRKKIVAPLLAFKDKLQTASGEEACRAVYDFLVVTHVPARLKEMASGFAGLGHDDAAENCVQVWDTLMALLDTLATTLGEEPVDPARFFELFSLIVSVTDIGSIPHSLDEITIGSAERIRIGAPRAVFLVGANADAFPLAQSGAAVFSSRERSKLKECGLELAESDEQSALLEKHITYSALTLAKERLFVSYAQASVSGQELLPSEIPQFLLGYFPACVHRSPEDVEDLERIESPDSGFEAAAKLFCENTPLSSALKTYFGEKEAYHGSLFALGRIARGEDFEIKNKETAAKLFHKDMELSASKVENYYNCPFQYFCKYGVAAKPRKVAKIDSLQNGLILHHIFEYLFGNHSVEGIRAMNEQERRALIDAALEVYIAEKLGGRHTLPKRLLFQLASFTKTAYVVLERILFEFGASKFEIRDVELQIGRDGKIPAYTLTLDDGGSISLSGVVDRLDVMKNGENTYFRIIDYKTGGKDFKLAEVLEGLNLQMLIYLMGIWQNGTGVYGPVTPAGVLYVPARLGKYELSRQSGKEETEAAKISLGKMNGILLNEEHVVRGMEPELRRQLIPVGQNKNGELTGPCISIQVFDLLRRVVDDKLRDMAERLHGGDIAANPADKLQNRTVCEFCDYQAACSHESTDPFRPIGGEKNEDIINEMERSCAQHGENMDD
ncbi:MAG: PD-(D/E)XK nuclease family protein [Oscillospiraceae bacterium]|nr:PD-(D/E)XK nuclease family protein [Oscillospiraceae bacterium]